MKTFFFDTGHIKSASGSIMILRDRLFVSPNSIGASDIIIHPPINPKLPRPALKGTVLYLADDEEEDRHLESQKGGVWIDSFLGLFGIDSTRYIAPQEVRPDDTSVKRPPGGPHGVEVLLNGMHWHASADGKAQFLYIKGDDHEN